MQFLCTVGEQQNYYPVGESNSRPQDYVNRALPTALSRPSQTLQQILLYDCAVSIQVLNFPTLKSNKTISNH